MPSTWEPNMASVSTPVRDLIQRDVSSLTDLRPRRPVDQGNLTANESRALKTLAARQEIIIKPADKGGQIVIQDRTNYVLEATRQLANTAYYRPLTQLIYLETQSLVRELVREMKEKRLITTRQANYLYGPDLPRPRLFYLLPKIHKPPESWTIPSLVPPGRPIVSDCGSESYRLAEFVDHYINPLSHLHPSYVKDTFTFVEQLRHLSVPEHTFLFSIDVDSLYTNIDTPLGLESVNRAFHSSPNPTRPDYFILKFLEITLTRNDFQFDNNFYLQTCGCAMGRKYSPAYADIYLADWEQSAFVKCPLQPLIYLRYLDDIFGLWDQSEAAFIDFFNILNSHHPRIKLKYTLNLHEIPFLDTVVFFTPAGQGQKQLSTKVYFKDTDRHSLLFNSSYHPQHTFRSIIKSQLIRFHRICSFPHHVEEATGVLFEALRPRGYSKRFLRTIKGEVATQFATGREATLQITTNECKLIPFVMTFSHHLGHFNKSIKQHFNSTQLQIPSLASFKVILAYRRNKNLKDMLVHTALNKTARPPRDPHFIHLKHVVGGRPDSGAPIWQKFTLLSSNLVYAIRCTRCGAIYVGETGATIKQRLYQHIYHINKNNNNKLLYTHFQHHLVSSLSFFGLEANTSWSLGLRRAAERRWIRRLSSSAPLGLNEK